MKPKNTSLLGRFFDSFLNVTWWAGGIIIAFTMLSLVYEVVSRRLFGKPTIWALDISTLSLLIAAMLPAAWVLRGNGHVNIELVSSKLSVKNRSLLNLISHSLALLGCLVMVWQGVDVTITAYQQNETLFRALVFPKVWYIWIFAVSFFLLAVELLRKIAAYYKEMRSGGK